MYKKLLIIFGLLLLASSASASDAWWDTLYQYRQPITLTGNTSGAQTNYQLMLNISYTSNMQSDFDDLRFTDDSGNLQSAWLEDKTDSSWADIWVNFTITPSDGETQTYYMYYGKTDAVDYWNIGATFIFGDDFSGSDLDTNKWYVIDSGSNVQETGGNLQVTGTDTWNVNGVASNVTFDRSIGLMMFWKTKGHQGIFGYGSYPLNYNDGIFIYSALPTQGFYRRLDGDTLNLISSYVETTWYDVEILLKQTQGYTLYIDNVEEENDTTYSGSGYHSVVNQFDNDGDRYVDYHYVRKYVASPSIYGFGAEEEYAPPPTPTPPPPPTPTPLKEITSSNYVIQNQTLYITKPSDIQYKITSNSFVYGGLRNINTIICDNNNTVISGWLKISTDKVYNCDYTFLINVNDTSYQSKIVTLKQEQVDSSIISKVYKRTLLIDGYEIYSYSTTVYIVSILPNPIYFYFNLEDRIIQFGNKQFDNQTLVFNQLNFDDQYEFMNNASSDTVVMKFKAINPSQKSGAELKGLTGILINVLSKIPFIGKSLKNILYYPLFFIQTIFNFVFTFLDIIVNDWWYALMTLEIVCIFSASRQKGYANVMEVYIKTHVQIIKFIYEVIILNMINLIITIVTTVKDMIKWW